MAITTAASRNIRIGIMVTIGLFLLVGLLYIIGNNQNLFGSTIKIKAKFTNVNGLNVGNNVRYVGIDIGTVSDIQILNDSVVLIEMTIESDATTYIRSNAIASIGTDGLMGNKLVNIQVLDASARYLKAGDVIQTIAPIDTDNIMHTLSKTNEDMSVIAENLKNISIRLEEDNMIWNLLGDSVIPNNLRRTMRNIEFVSADLTYLTHSFKGMTKDIKDGNGLVGALLYDTSFVSKMDHTMNSVQNVTDSLSKLTKDISVITGNVKKGEGTAGKILMDKKTEADFMDILDNIKKSSEALDENLEALKANILFRRYFKKKAKSEILK